MSTATLRAELLNDVAAHVEQCLRAQGVEQGHAEQCACAIADRLSEHWGGQVIYIPNDHAYRLSQREREILDALQSRSKSEVAMAYGISIDGINKLIRRRARRDVVDNQPDLFQAANP